MDTTDPAHTKRFVSFRLPASEVEAIEAFGRDVARRTPGLKVDRTAALRMLVLSALSRRDEIVGNLPTGDAQ